LGVRVEHIPRSRWTPGFGRSLRHLGQHEITSVLIEARGHVNWTALSTGVVDKLFLYYAPKILAGSSSFAASEAPGSHAIAACAPARNSISSGGFCS